jgi:hypothetical protein
MSTIKSSSEHLVLNADGALKDIILQNNGSTKVTVKSDGNVGIGTTDPRHLLDVEAVATGGIPTDAAIGASDANNNYFSFHNTSNSATFSGLALETRTSGASKWLIANEWKNSYLGDLVFRVRNGGSSSAERLRIQSGGGISFNGDTATANALDDYEEGTWTPTFSAGGLGVDSTPYAQYTKVGRVVTATCYVSTNSSGSSAAPVMTGLPFTAPSNGYSPFIINNNGGTGVALLGRVHPNTDSIRIYSAVDQANVTGSSIDATHLILTCVYQV